MSIQLKIFFRSLGFILVLVLVVCGYLGLNFVIDKIETKEKQIEEIHSELRQLQNRYDQLQNSFQETYHAIQPIKNITTNDWHLMIIKHLVYIADLSLNTTKDTELALACLLMAKQYTNVSELSIIKNSLDKDIVNLQALPITNIFSLISKIEILSKKINAMPVRIKQFIPDTESDIDRNSSVNMTLRQRFFISTIKALKDIVIIRHQAIETLLPEQEVIMHLTIQTKLLQAELAVINRQNQLYRECLEGAINLIIRYLVADRVALTSILETFKELQQVDLQPKLPSLKETLAIINNLTIPSLVKGSKST
ncbi:MAG: uroporphyrinogen-III C-methyltransferase [Coxiellaceae bacterium]|jgi:uncharacterized protein HemX|nr:uroporphyrinogen-III C-methyltransferase [Coxiellaceae bacterium]